MSNENDNVTIVLSRTDAQHAAHTLERGIGSLGWDKHSTAIAKIIREALKPAVAQSAELPQ